jgi:2-oxoglutarate ferredoxin oxidoreductase subunit delta
MVLGAICPIMPRKFVVRILESGCKGCGICAHFCPEGALEMSEGFTPKGYHPPRRRKGAGCKGCRNCELMCPDLAIFVEEEGK